MDVHRHGNDTNNRAMSQYCHGIAPFLVGNDVEKKECPAEEEEEEEEVGVQLFVIDWSSVVWLHLGFSRPHTELTGSKT